MMIADLNQKVKRGGAIMENLFLRQRAKKEGIPLWKIAASIGISEPTFTRWLRFPLSEDKERQVFEAISKLEREGH